MGKHVKTYKEFLKEAASWDKTQYRYIDKFFVSFDPKEDYEPRDFIKVVLTILQNHNIEVDTDELSDVVWACKDKIAHNHPRRALLQCVLKHYEIDITEIDD